MPRRRRRRSRRSHPGRGRPPTGPGWPRRRGRDPRRSAPRRRASAHPAAPRAGHGRGFHSSQAASSAPMKSSFLPGWPHMSTQQRAQVGEALPVVAGHLAQQRALAVHDLVVRERQHELLGVLVQAAEGELVVVEAPMDRVLAEVLERVVHPAHVPLEAEADAAEVGRAGDAREGGRLLGDGDGAGEAAVDALVHLAQERDRLQVLAAAVDVRRPLARPCASSRGRASRPRRRPAARRCDSGRTRTARWRRGSCGPPGARSRRSACPSRDARRAADRRARTAACRRTGAGRSRRSGSGPAPSRRSRRSRRCAASRPCAAKSSGFPKRDGRRVVAGHLVAPRPVERVLRHRQQLDVREAEAPAMRRPASRRPGGSPSHEPSALRIQDPRWTS